MNIKVNFDNIKVKETKKDFTVKILMLKGEKGEQGDLNPSHIVDNLTSNDSSKVLSAKQGKVLKDLVNKKPYYFDTVADMKAGSLSAGDYVITLGYYEVNDDGGATYKIRAKNESDIEDNGSIHFINANLVAELINNGTVNVKQFGAKGDGVTDDSSAFSNMLSICNYIYIPNGTYSLSESIILTTKQTVYGEDMYNTILVYTGSDSLIKNTGGQHDKNIEIHDLTIQGTNRSGNGIYFSQNDFDGSTWHRIYNLYILYCNYGIYLNKNLNETSIINIVTRECNYGIYLNRVDDFYLTNIITATSYKDGLKLENCSDGRCVNIKSWYSGIDFRESGTGRYYNINLLSCAVVNLTNVEAQESYQDNFNVYYCQNVSMKNCASSLPNLISDTSFTYSHIVFNGNHNCILEFIGNTKKIDNNFDVYWIKFQNENYNNIIKISPINEYPNNRLVYIDGSAQKHNTALRNEIFINNNKLNINNILNYAVNGDLKDTTDLSMITNGSQYCSWNADGTIRVTNDTQSDISLNIKRRKLPFLTNASIFLLIKSVSGTGRIVLNWQGWVEFGNDEVAGTDHQISSIITSNQVNENSEISIIVKPGITFDILKIGYCLGNSTSINCISA